VPERARQGQSEPGRARQCHTGPGRARQDQAVPYRARQYIFRIIIIISVVVHLQASNIC